MKVEKDFEEFIGLLNKHEVKYLIVGAYAMALYAEPRNTGDIDIFINPTKINADKILNVLKDFGFTDLDISINDLTKENMIVQLGVQPVRIDLLTSISGVKFKEAIESKEEKLFGSTKTFFISKELLIKNKKAIGRKKDLADLELLQKAEFRHDRRLIGGS
jgi:hypothetical protein